MAWYCVDLDKTLVMEDPETGSSVPIDGAVEAINQLVGEGHRVTVFTSRFAPMPEQRKQQVKEEIAQELLGFGFPEIEVWTGTTKPDADIFIGDKMVTFDQDWGLALAQSQMMLEERGLVPPPTGDPSMGEEPAPQETAPEQAPAEEA